MSRRGTNIAKLTLMALLLAPLPQPVRGAVLGQRYEPEALLPAPPERLEFFEPQPRACAQDAGCLLELPHSALPAVLAVPRRAHLSAATARALLPASKRWLLAAANISNAKALVPAAPRAGQPPHADSLPFSMVARADQWHVAGMFVIGIGLLLAGTALGLIIRAPAEPFTPGAEPWIPGSKVLPRLVTSPISPAHLRPQP